jgi:asparagine synthase (glutamine-hydrolysing)
LKDEFRRLHPHWHLSEPGARLSVFHARPSGRSEEAITLGNEGLILGTLFPQNLGVSPVGWRPRIDPLQARAIVSTHGRYLMDNFWGSYVAFLNNADGTEQYILRDCSGKIPCFCIAHDGTTIVFSNLSDLAGLSLPRFSINPSYLAGFLYEPELAQRECALNEVREVLAGECLELGKGRAHQFAMWDPRIVCRNNPIEDFDEASRQVGRVTQACIDFWASKYDRIVHQLSGGLDSSIVLGCLKKSPHSPRVTCLHLETTGADGSEVGYARLAADTANIELVVQPGYTHYAKYDERVFRLPKSSKPNVSSLAVTLESDLRNRVPAQAEAEAIWDGQGGDHLFFESRSAFEAIDYAFVHGLLGDFRKHAQGAVRRSRLSYWGVLAKSTRLGVLRRAWCPESEYHRVPTFTNPAIIPKNIVDYAWQPWLDGAQGIPPGKRWQICILACLIHRHRPVPELQYAGEHHPLFSQPLFELCLRIPIYTLLRGGTDRALERNAFRHCVPERILRRENKGSSATTLMSKIRECLPFLRDLILDGVLVQERILDRASLEPFLAGNRPLDRQVYWPFMSCIAAEVWARRWACDGWRL